jgi:OFA family oxalate/formate antiporter-like MFS transporter
LCGIGWLMNAHADSLSMLYFAAIVSGVGAGAVYGTCVGNSLKWFPDRRGLAAGLTAAGFGAGSALTVIPISNMIKAEGYQAAFQFYGILQAAVVVVIALLLKNPAKVNLSKYVSRVTQKVQQVQRNYRPLELLKQPVFWVMYAMFVMVAAGGLMATAQLAPIAKDFGINDVPVEILGLVLPALTFALTIDRVLNGLTRPFFGWVSDKIGREQTMCLAFTLESIGILCLYQFGSHPVAFVLLTGLVFFAWGEIYSLFPSTCADTFGTQYAAGNAGLLYTAKGTAAFLVPLTSMVSAATGNWHLVFILASVLNAIAAWMAWFVLRPMRQRHIERNS